MSIFMKLKEAGAKVYVRLLLGAAVLSDLLQQSSTAPRLGTRHPTAPSQLSHHRIFYEQQSVQMMAPIDRVDHDGVERKPTSIHDIVCLLTL